MPLPILLDDQQITRSKNKNTLVQWYVHLHPHQPLSDRFSFEKLQKIFTLPDIQQEMEKIIAIGIHKLLDESSLVPIYSDNLMVSIFKQKCTIFPEELAIFLKDHSENDPKRLLKCSNKLVFMVQIITPSLAPFSKDFTVRPSSVSSPFAKTPRNKESDIQNEESTQKTRSAQKQGESGKKSKEHINSPKQQDEHQHTPKQSSKITREADRKIKRRESTATKEQQTESETPAEQKQYLLEDVILYVQEHYDTNNKMFRPGTVRLFNKMYTTLSDNAKMLTNQLLSSIKHSSEEEPSQPKKRKRQEDNDSTKRKKLKLRNPDDL
jgi:hypothetical protein